MTPQVGENRGNLKHHNSLSMNFILSYAKICSWAALAEVGCLLYSTRSAAAAVICFKDN